MDISALTMTEFISELTTYTELANDEWQESVDLLCQVVRYNYCYTDETNTALENELRLTLQYCRDNAVISEEEHTETYTRTVKTLRWE